MLKRGQTRGFANFATLFQKQPKKAPSLKDRNKIGLKIAEC